MNDVLVNKSETIRRCLARVAVEYQDDPTRLENFTVQDSIVLNLQRACEAAIDLAMHRVAEGRIGVPQSSRDAFSLLESVGILNQKISESMQAMVGFRNIAVHSYQELQLPILQAIIADRLKDFESFIKQVAANQED